MLGFPQENYKINVCFSLLKKCFDVFLNLCNKKTANSNFSGEGTYINAWKRTHALSNQKMIHVLCGGQTWGKENAKIKAFWGKHCDILLDFNVIRKNRLQVDPVQQTAHVQHEELKVWLIPAREGGLWEHRQRWETTGFGLITHFL